MFKSQSKKQLKWWRTAVIILLVILLLLYFPKLVKRFFTNDNWSNSMRISTSALDEQGKLLDAYTCRGNGYNPPLALAEIPADAQSLAIIVDDPDAPKGDFIHWLVWNIDPAVRELASHQLPQGAIEGQNSLGQTGYTAPCPPSGTHHYHFKVYALDEKLSLDEQADQSDLLAAMKDHILAQGEFVALVSADETTN